MALPTVNDNPPPRVPYLGGMNAFEIAEEGTADICARPHCKWILIATLLIIVTTIIAILVLTLKH